MKLKKQDVIKIWENLDPKNPFPFMTPIPANHKGKTFGLPGVRIDGSEEFIMAILSNLKPLLAGENTSTRLNVSFIDCSEAKDGFNKGNGGAVCYIRLHQRPKEKCFNKKIIEVENPIIITPIPDPITFIPQKTQKSPETLAAIKALETQKMIEEIEKKALISNIKISDDPDNQSFDSFNAQNRAILKE
jgi:hypothetical protein